MEGRQRKLDVAKVTIARVEALAARSALSLLARDAHVRVHGPVGREGAGVVRGGLEVVDIAVGYFENGLVHNVLVGAGACYYASFTTVATWLLLLYAELDVLDARGDAVHDLLLGRGARRLHCGRMCVCVVAGLQGYGCAIAGIYGILA